MLIERSRGDSVCHVIHCDALREVAGAISDFSVVWFDRGDAGTPGGVIATSGRCDGPAGAFHEAEIPAQAEGGLRRVAPLGPDADSAVARLLALAVDLQARPAGGDGAGQSLPGGMRAGADDSVAPDGAAPRWAAFECVFRDGTRDVVLIRTTGAEDDICRLLDLIWPGLRRLCLDEMRRALTGLPDAAMLWLVQRKVNASVLVLDEECNLLRANAAGADLLKRGDLLRVSAGRLCSVNERATAGLHRMVRDVFQAAEKDRKAREYVLLLRPRKRAEGEENAKPLPMTLTPFQAPDGRRVLIALLPLPPERRRIEHLARKMGLTPSEARVAALIRAGYSNREAAKIAGLKVETFNTYAKRALAKMNVSGRADMAQMLTWQAAMERPS